MTNVNELYQYQAKLTNQDSGENFGDMVLIVTEAHRPSFMQ